MGAKFKSVDEYIGTFPEEVQSILTTLRQTIKQAAPQAEELISYNMPAFKQNGFLVSYAAWKKHIGMYPVPAGDQAFQKAIAPFTTEKSTAQFPLNQPMPLKLIAQLIAFRLKENNKRVQSTSKN
ncbi:DUF1801 domain-containing protein [uncultured Imperialibacter sp.]|uniref:iron chaperone n=1 Tax=uncultured Imperialibacter sp. TaxID=1672639 RepID=UPI0030D76E58|tara:strand:+ start:43048 stop:43422 length:375 start_codon:yes stop_codon:yes gene_type:complete